MGATILLSLLPFSTSFGGIKYSLYVKDGGPEMWSWATDGGVAGTTGQSRKTDAFQISGFEFPVEFRIHVERDGWREWKPAAENIWDTGGGKRLEAIGFRFPEGIPSDTIILGRAHVQGIGWMPIVNFQDLKDDPDHHFLGTTGQSLRLEAIQIVEGSGADADENLLREKIDKEWNAINVVVQPMGGGGKAYHLPDGKGVIVEELSSPFKASEEITIVNAGPSAVYYHTEGNPPGLGDNDNGYIAPGQYSTFKITALAAAFTPTVYLEAKQGQTDSAVFIGPMQLTSTPNLLRLVRQY